MFAGLLQQFGDEFVSVIHPPFPAVQMSFLTRFVKGPKNNHDKIPAIAGRAQAYFCRRSRHLYRTHRASAVSGQDDHGVRVSESIKFATTKEKWIQSQGPLCSNAEVYQSSTLIVDLDGPD